MSRAITADGRRAGALIIERSYREGDDRQFLRVFYATAMACRVGRILALGRSTGLTNSTLTERLMSNEAVTGSLCDLTSESIVIKGRHSLRVRKAA